MPAQSPEHLLGAQANKGEWWSVCIRPFQASDLAALQALYESAGLPPAVDQAVTQPEDTLGDDALQRFVATDGRGLVGCAYVARSAWHPPGWYQGEVFVRPIARRRGVGSALAGRVEALAGTLGAETLTTWVDGQAPAAEHFAVRRGFAVVQRFVTMTLNVAHTEGEALDHWVSAARQRGVTLFSYEETGGTGDAPWRLYELNRRLAPLLPGNGEAFPTFEDYRREILEAAWFRPEGQLIAAVGDRWVGLAGLGFYEEGRRLHHEFTAVDAAYQRRGIALALKAWSVQRARAWGVREIRTGNDHSNTAIIELNRRLGYTLQPGVVKLRRAFPTAP
ncbi:GNAT family N-acetyltransferase [Deinococcus sonorensis]|uniref:GNAT family N-acetyltransferase n=2 Tax=Deinococcus sonorensis TaxID=309891 RepID=A0AAU7U6T9_9DEIO